MRTRVDLPDADGKVILFEDPAGGSTQCLISAHGWFTGSSPQYTVTVPLSFYCAHGQTVDDVLSVKGWSRQMQVGPTLQAGAQVTDYTLGKLQEHHKDVAEYMKGMNKNLGPNNQATLNEAALEMWNMGMGETYIGLEQRFSKVGFDVATVRNRNWFKGGNTIRLSEVIAIVEAHRHYNEYHAVFCRERK